MPERVTTKDVTIGDFKYQIKKMDPRTGSWIATNLVTKMLPSMMSGADDITAGAKLPPGRAELSEVEFHNIQDHCLEVCYRYEKVGEQIVPITVFRDGKFSAGMDLDVVEVLQLTFHALLFNVAPFFGDSALKGMLQTFQDLSPFNAPK